MPTQEDIQDQLELLATHRRTLRVYLRQQANLGASYAPPGIVSGIEETRRAIAKVKSNLRSWGVKVGDHPDDFESRSTSHIRSSPSKQNIPASSSVTAKPSQSSASSGNADAWKELFHHTITTDIIKDPQFIQKWATLTFIGFVINLFLSTGIYFTSDINKPLYAYQIP
jgi:hypothetical protein